VFGDDGNSSMVNWLVRTLAVLLAVATMIVYVRLTRRGVVLAFCVTMLVTLIFNVLVWIAAVVIDEPPW